MGKHELSNQPPAHLTWLVAHRRSVIRRVDNGSAGRNVTHLTHPMQQSCGQVKKSGFFLLRASRPSAARRDASRPLSVAARLKCAGRLPLESAPYFLGRMCKWQQPSRSASQVSAEKAKPAASNVPVSIAAAIRHSVATSCSSSPASSHASFKGHV